MSDTTYSIAIANDCGYVERVSTTTWFPDGAYSLHVGDIKVAHSLDGSTYKVDTSVARYTSDLSAGVFVSAGELLLTLDDIDLTDSGLILNVEYYPFDGSLAQGDYSEQGSANAASIALSEFTVGVQKVIPLANASLNIPRSGIFGIRLAIANEDTPTGINAITALRANVQVRVYFSAVQKADQLTPNGGAYDRTQPIPVTFRHNDALSRPMTSFDWRYSSDGGATYSSPTHVVSSAQSYSIAGSTVPAGTIKHQVRTYVSADYGDWSEAATFTAGAAVDLPVVTAPSGVVTTAFPTVTWISTETNRQAFYVVIEDDDTAAIYYSSGRVAGNALSHVVASALPDDKNLLAKVAVEDENGIISGYDDIAFQTALSPVPEPSISVIPIDSDYGEQSGIRITGTAPEAGGGESPIETIAIQRTFDSADKVADGTAQWKTIKSGLEPDEDGQVEHDDYDPPSKRVAFYRLVATGENGATSTGAADNAEISHEGVWLAKDSDVVSSLLHYPTFEPTKFGTKTNPDTVIRRYHGRSDEVAISGEHRTKQLPMSLRVITDNSELSIVRDIDAIDTLFNSKARLLVKTNEVPRGNTYKGSIVGEYTITPVPEFLMAVYDVSFTLNLTGEQVL